MWIDQISTILVGSPTELGSENASETYLLFALPYQEGTPSRGHSFIFLLCVRIFSEKG